MSGQIVAKKALSIPEAVEVTGVSRSTLYREIRDKRLKAIKVGRRTLVGREAIDEWLAAMPAA